MTWFLLEVLAVAVPLAWRLQHDPRPPSPAAGSAFDRAALALHAAVETELVRARYEEIRHAAGIPDTVARRDLRRLTRSGLSTQLAMQQITLHLQTGTSS